MIDYKSNKRHHDKSEKTASKKDKSTKSINDSTILEELKLPESYQDDWSTGEELLEFAKNVEPKKRLFGDFIHEKSLCHFPSERGVGKSLLLMQLSIAICNLWTDFLGQRIDLYGPVIYVNAEMDKETFALRYKKLKESAPHFGPVNNHHQFYTFTTRKSFNSFQNELKNYIGKIKPVLVILDNWTVALRDTDGKREQISKLMIDLLNLKDELRFAMVIADHTRKNINNMISSSDMQSGSGAKTDLSDQDFMLRKTKDSEKRLLKRMKSRNAPEQRGSHLLFFDQQSLWFELSQESVNESEWLTPESLESETQETKLEIARQLQEQGKSLKHISEVVGISTATLSRKLNNSN